MIDPLVSTPTQHQPSLSPPRHINLLESDLEKGTIHLRNVNGRLFLIPAATWPSLRLALIKAFRGGAISFMVQIGYSMGSTALGEMRKLETTPSLLIRLIPTFARSAGWGSVQISGDVHTGKALSVRVENCPYCQSEMEEAAPLCDFLCGFVNGMVDQLWGTPHKVVEVECTRAGGKACEVAVAEIAQETDDRARWGAYVLFPWLTPDRR